MVKCFNERVACGDGAKGIPIFSKGLPWMRLEVTSQHPVLTLTAASPCALGSGQTLALAMICLWNDDHHLVW